MRATVHPGKSGTAWTAAAAVIREGFGGRVRWSILVGLVLAGLLPGPSPAAQGGDSLNQDRAAVRFRHLTIDDGLSQNAVNALLQDRHGFLWIGTQDGLNRYDGASFSVYRHDPFDPATLSSSYVKALYKDADGYLWVGTLAAGLNRLDPITGHVIRYANTAQYHITAIHEGPDEALWVGTTGDGPFRLDRDAMEDPQATFSAVRLTPDATAAPASIDVHRYFVDRERGFWVDTNIGIYRYDRAQRRLARYAPGPSTAGAPGEGVVSDIAQAPDGTLWLGTPQGLRRVTSTAGGRFTSTLFPLALAPSELRNVRMLVGGPDGTLWFVTGAGLHHFDPATETYRLFQHDASDPESLAGNLITALLWDRAGVLWVGTNGYGLDRHDTKRARFQMIRRPPDLRSPATGFSVRTLFEDRDGTLWISAHALYRYDVGTGRLDMVDTAGEGPVSVGAEEVMSIIQDRRGELWFASVGLHRYDPRTGRTRVYRFEERGGDGPLRDKVNGVHEDRQGRIWVWTAHHISRLDDPETGRFTHFLHTPENLTSDLTPSIHEGTRGFFWIATEAGLVRFDPRTGTVKRYRTDPSDPNSLSQDLVRSVLPDPVEPDRILWIGTAGGGLNRFDIETETFTHITEGDGLPNNVVYAVLPDAGGRLWLSTNRGLARYDPRTGEVKHYDASDGLQSDEFNAGAYHRTADGRLYFGGIYGVNVFDPDAFADNPHVPPVVLTGLRVGDRPVAVGDSTGLLDRALWATETLRLSHRENMVTFSFAALDFSAPTKNRYAYRMEGFDDAWIRAGTNRTATYTNLPPGRYTFRVRGTNNDGVWNEEGAALAVVVAPPWWRAWWAYLGYLLLVLGAVTLVYRNRQNRLRLRHRMEMDQLEAENLRALDHAKSRFFANVSHEFRTPLTLTIGPLDDLKAGLYGPLDAPMAQQVDLARRNAGRVLDLIHQILDVARLEAGRTRLHAQPVDLGAFVAALAQPFEALAARKAIAFEVDRSGADPEVYLDPPQFEKVIVNLLSNALKFTVEGGAVRLTVSARDGAARVAVRDSGPGIPAADVPHVFDRFYQVNDAEQTQLGTGIGLALAKEVVELHGGTIAVESEEGFGSTFTVTLPLGRAHLAPEQIVDDPVPWTPEGERPVLSEGDGQTGRLRDDVLLDADGDDVTTVLVVEDHPEVRAYVRRHLTDGVPAYRVLEAADGEAGLAMARERLPDLVLSDVMMPKLDGIGLCRALKADPQTDFIPVILLTAKAAPEDKVEGLEEQADDYLTKPFEPAELRARIANLIAVRQRLRERFRLEGMALVLGDDGVLPRPSQAEPGGRAGEGPLRPAEVSSADEAFLEQVHQAIEAHLGDDTFSVERLAEAVGISRGHLHRQLKALLGQTPSEVLRTQRLERSASLLAARAGTVSEIAYAVGFKSVGHFSDCFVEAFGCRPSAYPDEA